MKKTKHECLAEKYENPTQRRIKTEIDYTLHPPEGKFTQEDIRRTPAYISQSIKHLIENVVSSDTMIILNIKDDHRNPIDVMEAFYTAHYAGLYPPMWVLNHLAEIFSEWHQLQGAKSLDELMGLKPRPGQAPLLKKDFENIRDETLCLAVFALKTLFNFTVEEASHMAARRLEETPNWNKTRFALKPIAEDTVRDRYKRKYSKIYNNSDIKEQFLDWNKERKLEFLRSFPEDSFPARKGEILTPEETIYLSGVK